MKTTKIKPKATAFTKAVSVSVIQSEKTLYNPLEEIKELFNERNCLVKAVKNAPSVQSMLDKVVNDLCDKLAFLSVKKVLEFKQSNPTNMPSSSLNAIDKMLSTLYLDYSAFKAWRLDEVFSDNIPLYDLAYVTAFEYLNKPIILQFDDVVHTHVKRDGNEKDYTLYQYIKSVIHKDIRAWSVTDSQSKILWYLVGYTDEGKQILTKKRPAVDIDDIDVLSRLKFLKGYGLTDRQSRIMLYVLDGKKADFIAVQLSLNIRMVQRDIKTAKHLMSLNNHYIKE